MIDPTKISNFNLSKAELEENILFWVCAAGKSGVTSARLLNDFINRLRTSLYVIGYQATAKMTPFEAIRCFIEHCKFEHFGFILNPASYLNNNKPVDHSNLFQWMMKDSGIGNHTSKSRSFIELAKSHLDLKTCSVDDLSRIHGIGPKTARAFLVHTRPDQRYAVVDTHLLKFLRDQGIMAPKSTPPEGPTYRRLEETFLSICDKYSLQPHHLDLAIWNHYRKTAFVFDLEAYQNEYHNAAICSSCDGRR